MKVLEEDLIVWIDCEMTGLELSKDHIIEIACIVTDKNLNILEEAPNIIINYPEKIMASMDEWCTEHHTQSGLVEAVKNSKILPEEADTIISEFIKKYFPNKGSAILAGNSVHVDKKFLEKDFPKTYEYFHYRIIDVSTVKELTRRWYPEVFNNLPSIIHSQHRALDDIKDSINELSYYREKVFNQKLNPTLSNSNNISDYDNDKTNKKYNSCHNNNYNNSNSNSKNHISNNNKFNNNNNNNSRNNNAGNYYKEYPRSMNNGNPPMNTKNNPLKHYRRNDNSMRNNNNIKKRKSCGAVVYKMENDTPLFLIEHMVKGHTSLPKGHVEGKETEEETALREIHEETNLEVDLDTGFRHIISYSPKKGVHKDVVFFIAEAKNGEMKNQESEVKGLEWLPIDQAVEAMTYKEDKETLIKGMEYLKKNNKK